MATARAVAQDRREPQRRRHACSTRFLSRNLSERALPWASRLRNDRVSVDHRPPTSTPSWSCPSLALGSGYVRSFRRRAASRATPSLRAAFRRPSPFAWRALTTVVSTTDWTPQENGESIDHHFQTTRVMHIWSSQIPVAHHDVGGDSTPCFAADTGCNVLHSESPPPQNPSTSTSCAVVATGIEWKATPAVAPCQREGKAKTTKEKDSEQVLFQKGDPTQRLWSTLASSTLANSYFGQFYFGQFYFGQFHFGQVS